MLSSLLSVLVFAGMQMFSRQLGSSEWLTILGGFLGSVLFVCSLTVSFCCFDMHTVPVNLLLCHACLISLFKFCLGLYLHIYYCLTCKYRLSITWRTLFSAKASKPKSSQRVSVTVFTLLQSHFENSVRCLVYISVVLFLC